MLPTQTASAQEASVLRQSLEVASGRLAELELSYQELTKSLNKFLYTYTIEILSLYLEVERLKLTREKQAYEKSLRDGGMSRDEAKKEVDKKYKKQEVNQSKHRKENQKQRKRFEEAVDEKKITRDEEKELKDLYRKLAKRFHPDLVKDQKERTVQEDKMKKINESYKKKDLDALRHIWETDGIHFNETFLSSEAELAILKKRLATIEQSIHHLEVQMTTLKEGDEYKLMQDFEDHREKYAALKRSLKQELKDLQAQIETA